jgi:3-phosphoshikimate 1-carboxyvinyltransferase
VDVVIQRSVIEGKAVPPPSKSYTHRTLLAALLSPLARIYNPLIAEDTLATLNACYSIGARIQRFEDFFVLEGVDSIDASGYIYAANSGTTLRLFLSILSLSKNPSYAVLDGDSSLRKRPNNQLVSVLKRLGADIRSKDSKAPLWVRGVIKGDRIEIEAESSQFISSLLFSLPLARGDSALRVLSTKSRPYLEITLHVLGESGIEVGREDYTFYIPGEQRYLLKKFSAPSDFSSASYLIAAGLLAGNVRIEHMFESKQGDQRIVDIAREMGGKLRWDKEKGEIKAEKSELEGIEVDATDIPDLIPTISVLAAVARGRTRIYNAGHLRVKEIDRIDGICKNLKALGVDVKERKDGFEILGKESIESGIVNSFGDHRMALAFSLLGLVAKKVVVKSAEVISVSFPGYFEVLKSIGADVQ